MTTLKTLGKLALFTAFTSLAFGQNAALLPVVRPQFLDNNGAPLVGGYLYTCTAGTTCLPAFVGDPPVNPLATYTDSSAGVANSNPIILDSAGRAGVWLGSGNYKLVLQDQFGVTQWSQDNVSSLSLKAVSAITGAVSNFNVPGALTAGSIVTSGTIGASGTITGANLSTAGTLSVTGAVTAGSFTGVKIPSIKATTGTRYLCIDTSGNVVSQTTACSGT